MKILLTLAMMAHAVVVGVFVMTGYRIFVTREINKISFERRKRFHQRTGMVIITIATLFVGIFHQGKSIDLLQSSLIGMYFLYLFMVFFYLPKLERFVK